jgi:hypothetical protein
MEPYVHDAVLDMHMAREELLAVLADVPDDGWSRFVPYGSRTLHDLLAHLAGADQAWAVAARGLLRGEAEDGAHRSPADVVAARERAIARGRGRSPRDLLDEMASRRKLLLGLYDLLEPRHLALALRSYGDEHNSVRERIWLGYHDRLHADDVRRALRMDWHPPHLKMLPELAHVAVALSPSPALYVAYSVDPVFWQRPSPDPGWSYHDLLAHIATGDWVLQSHLRHLIDHGSPAEWPDVAAGNAERVAERRFSTERALIDEYLSSRHQTMLLLADIEPKHLSQPIEMRWLPEPHTRTVGDYLGWFDTHDRFHREQLRGAMKYVQARTGAK